VGYGLATSNASEAASENGPFYDSADIIFGDSDMGAVDQPSSFDTGDQTPTATVAGGNATVPVAVNPNQNNAGFSPASFLGGGGTIFGLPTTTVLIVAAAGVAAYLLLRK
jgi:hypothetical protein